MGKKLDKRLIKKLYFFRQKGYSIPEISLKLNLPKTTVFNYVKNVQMLPEVVEDWRSKRGGGRKLKLLKEKQALAKAKILIKKISKKENLLFISALYWAEGNKKDFMLSNTDPNLISVFVKGIREIFSIGDDKLRVSIRIYEDMDKDKCLNFWESIVGLPKDKFQNVYILKGRKQGKLEYGMCRIRVAKGGDLLKLFTAINRIVANQAMVG